MKVQVKHLQLEREVELRGTVEQIVTDLRIDLTESYRAAEHQHYELVQHAFDVSGLPDVAALIETVTGRINTAVQVQIFVTQMPVAQAATFARGYFGKDSSTDRAVVIVSQHFFNDLEFDEQVAVLGHELGHIVFGHGRLPVNALLKASDRAIDELRPILSEYSTCCEVSCDLVAAVATQGEWLPVASSLIRMQTGLSQSFIDSNRGLTVVLDALQAQLEAVHLNPLEAQMGTHPITPARLEMLRNFAGNNLVRAYGRELSPDIITEARAELGKQFRSIIGSIYWPSLDSSELPESHRAILGRLAIAVALADGRLEPNGAEARVLSTLLGRDLIRQVLTSKRDVDALLAEAGQMALEERLATADAVRLVRYAAVVAAADGLDPLELKALHTFGSAFDMSAELIAAIAQQTPRATG